MRLSVITEYLPDLSDKQLIRLQDKIGVEEFRRMFQKVVERVRHDELVEALKDRRKEGLQTYQFSKIACFRLKDIFDTAYHYNDIRRKSGYRRWKICIPDSRIDNCGGAEGFLKKVNKIVPTAKFKEVSYTWSYIWWRSEIE